MTDRFSAISNFFKTYKAAVRIAWVTRKDLLIWLTLVNALDGLLWLPRLYAVKWFIDAAVYGISSGDIKGSTAKIIIFALIEFIATSGSFICVRLDFILSQALSRYVNVHIQTLAMSKINTIPVWVAEDPKTRDLFKMIQDTAGNRVWGLVMSLSTLPKSLFSLISSSIPIISYSYFLIIPGIVLAILDVVSGKKIAQMEYKLVTKQASVWRYWQAYDDFISKGKYLYENKIFGHFQYLIDKIKKLANETFEERKDMELKGGKYAILTFVPTRLFVAGIRVFMYTRAILGTIGIGSAQIVSDAIGSLVNDISSLINNMNKIYESYLFVQDFNYLINLPDESMDTSDKKYDDKDKKLSIEFKNVWFKYPSSQDWILKDVSFEIKSRSNIALVGQNGAGKSTLIKLICGFYYPQKGNIYINGTNTRKYNPITLRKDISVLFQDFAQYPFSAGENILYGDINKLGKQDEIVNSARIVDIDEFIDLLPKKYDNPLDNELEGGIEPSKGQWQRIALARALFKDSSILILDEPTSNVDAIAEEKIFENIIRVAKHRTILLVSHRFSTVRKINKILVLDDGKIVEFGNHNQLMKLDGKYSHLFNLQAKSYQ